jgi:two-component system CheB/CheR fusion protein
VARRKAKRAKKTANRRPSVEAAVRKAGKPDEQPVAASPPRVTAGVPVVVIGASAGGLDPIGRFLSAMPADSNVAIVVIQHLHPTSRSMLAELLAKHTAMTVRPAVDGLALMPREVYVIPPGVYMTVSAGRLHFEVAPAGMGARMPIDVFLYSLATESGNRGIGIIMSGTGTDGAQGLKALKEAGGLALVQDPKEAQQDGMPRHAILTARPDDVLPVKAMPPVLLRYIAHDYVKARPAGATVREVVEQPALAAVIDLLRASTGQDFGRYKPGTLQRRIERRMALRGIRSWANYLTFVGGNPAEADALAKDLLINVTRFFRDPEAYAALAEQLPAMLSTHSLEQPVRAWVAGCSTGEEAYSIGMLLLEHIAAVKPRLRLQIFATDIDEDALKIARTGVYPDTIEGDVSPRRLKDFFVAQEDRYRVAKELRDAIVFSRHDLPSDPPFSKLDLVSCRNVLIYLRPETQLRVLTLLHFGLREGGLLFLGPAESVSATSGLFEPVDDAHRIYRRRASEPRARVRFGATEPGRVTTAPSPFARPAAPRSTSLPSSVQRMMLDTYAPAAVVVSRTLSPLYYFGATDRFLQIAAGEPNQDVLSMARDGVRPGLRQAIARAFREKRRAAVHGVWVKRNGESSKVTIEAQPLPDEQEDLVLVSFLEEPAKPGAVVRRAAGSRGRETSELARLRAELGDSHKELNRSMLDLRQVNEQLKAKNEEAMSLNEEFLSTNEELESSKEELQSLNEELTTLNSQLRQSLEQERRASTDLTNLLNSSAVATILLDDKLRIKLFNPRMRALFNVIDTDIGRPLADLVPKFADPTLLADATAARADGTPSDREIRAESGTWYLRSVLPYRTEGGGIEGAVVTFSDVSQLKQARLDTATARGYAEIIVDTIGAPLVVIDKELKVVSTNSAFRATFDIAADQAVGQALRDLGPPIFRDPQLLDLVARVLPRNDGTEHIDLEIAQRDGGTRVWRAEARQLWIPKAERPMILLALNDITDQRRIVRQQLQLMIDALPGVFLAVDGQRRIRFVSGEVGPLFGYRAEELIGQPVDILVPRDLRERHAGHHAGFFAAATPRRMGAGLDIHGVAKDGSRIPLEVGLSPVQTADGLLIIAAVRDLRPQEKGEELLRAAKAEADRATKAKSRVLAAASHDLRQPLQTISLLHGLLEKRVTDPEGRATLTRLDNTIADVIELLDTLLDINQIESGEIKPQTAEFSLAPFLARIRDEFTPLAASKGLQLRTVPSSVVIRSDRRLLARMVSNLVSNAIKYTTQGKVLVGCRRRGDAVRIEVWDTGAGIPPESIDRIFEEFYRLERVDGEKFGLGLGLYIVQRFAELLGHKVEVRSKLGKGTMFAIVANASFAVAPHPPARHDRAATTAHARVLLVEDDATQLDTLCALLAHDGYHVAGARRGGEALAQLREAPDLRPDVVVADYNLAGGMNGLEVI